MLTNIKKYIDSNRNLKTDFTIGAVTAVLFSAFIYFEHFNMTLKLLNTIFAILSLGLFLYIPKRAVLIAGFMVGLLWFYWIGYSFKYYHINYMEPFVTLVFGIVCMAIFGILALTNSVALRAIMLFFISFFEPFDFNWLQIEVIFVDSYIGLFKYQLATLLLALSLPAYINNRYKYAPLLLIIFALNFNMPIQKDAPLKIKLVATDIKQDIKWERASLSPTILMIYSEIEDAIKDGYDVVVLPESVFPLYMNKSTALIDKLLMFSKDITIVAGTLINENNLNYNVTYMFNNGRHQIAKKLVLVPFGEYVPLPKFAQKFINNYFFDGTADFKTATKPTDFVIKNIKFRNAICYEATCQEIYDGDVDFVVAISNNAWFAPSIEPTLQKLLMRYYARKNGVTVYHSANYKGTGIVK